MNAYVEKVYNGLVERNGHEKEFLQAVREVLEALSPVFDKHPEYENKGLLERFVEPDRAILFRVPWVDDQGKVQVNKGYGGGIGKLNPYSTYTGATILYGGTMEADNLNDGGVSSLGAGGPLVLGPGTFRYTGPDGATCGRAITNVTSFSQGTAFDVQHDLTLTGKIAWQVGGFVKTGPGTLYLNNQTGGTNTFSRWGERKSWETLAIRSRFAWSAFLISSRTSPWRFAVPPPSSPVGEALEDRVCPTMSFDISWLQMVMKRSWLLEESPFAAWTISTSVFFETTIAPRRTASRNARSSVARPFSSEYLPFRNGTPKRSRRSAHHWRDIVRSSHQKRMERIAPPQLSGAGMRSQRWTM